MKLTKILCYLTLIFCVPAILVSSPRPSGGKQQPQTITITVSLADADLILEGLGELPAKKSSALIQNIISQAQKQLQQKPVADTTKPAKKN